MSKSNQFTFQAVSDFLSGKLSRRETAELLEVWERTVTRLARRIEDRGLFGTVHGNRSRPPSNKKSKVFQNDVMKLVEEKYFDFNMTHCLEVLKSSHGLELQYSTFRRWCHGRELVKRRKRSKSSPRSKRVRMPSEGLLLQMDGSPHRYNGKDEWCLIAAIDDATSDIPYAEFFLSEDTINCSTVMQKIVEKKGIPYAIYVDQAGCLGGGKRAHFNQFKRACEELNIRIIFASSPQAKGRIERTWDTFQDRIVPEMRVRGIYRMPAANDYLQNQFIPNYWRTTNTVVAKNLESRYQKVPVGLDLREVFCLKEYRAVKADHTLSYDSVTYQLISPLKYSIQGQKIEIRTYQDLTWKAFFAGQPIELTPLENSVRLKLAS
ncbi:MAG: ISNCY family transposase [Cryobacterium sp.]|nr:ISNCY family transposase [Oligoflexia bacterium]